MYHRCFPWFGPPAVLVRLCRPCLSAGTMSPCSCASEAARASALRLGFAGRLGFPGGVTLRLLGVPMPLGLVLPGEELE